nr:DUF99 family protein [Algicola sagamiensis]
MKSLAELIRLKKQIRAIGIDDAPFQKETGSPVNLSGIICSDTRFEGMLWGEVQKDGDDATDKIIQLIQESKFYSQINAVLLDGIAVGGFNIIDLALLSESLQRPCIAVMRKQLNILKIHQALDNFADAERRKQLIAKAGEIYPSAILFSGQRMYSR